MQAPASGSLALSTAPPLSSSPSSSAPPPPVISANPPSTPAVAADTAAVPAPAAAATTPAAINFATEWLDELGHVCPKAVDYASQCPKGHALVAFSISGGDSDAAAQRVMCRVCHTLAERDLATQWLTCSVAGCCAGYAVCGACVGALQQPRAAAAACDDFPSLVWAAVIPHMRISRRI